MRYTDAYRFGHPPDFIEPEPPSMTKFVLPRPFRPAVLELESRLTPTVTATVVR